MARANGKLSGKIVRSSGNVFADLGFADAVNADEGPSARINGVRKARSANTFPELRTIFR